MNKSIIVSLIIGMTAFFFSCNPSGKSENSTLSEKVTIISAERILTMEDVQPEVEAFAVSGKQIVALGNLEDLKKKYPDASHVHHEGKTLIPGFIDSHVHIIELGERYLKADLTKAKTVEDMVVALKNFYPNPEKGQWLFGTGWDEGQWASLGYPDRKLIDEAFPNNPIKMISMHGFATFYNGKALEIAGINKSTKEPKVGKIIRRKDGTPTGVMETLASRLVDPFVPLPNKEELKKQAMLGMMMIRKKGVTSLHEAGLSPDKLEALMELNKEGKMPVRMYAMLNGNDSTMMIDWFAKGILVDSSAHFTVRSIKVFYDGSLGSRTALLREPYSDDPHANMTQRISTEKMDWLASIASVKGFQMTVHAIGDEANDRTLVMIEKAFAGKPKTDHRWRIEHAQVVLPDFYERAKKCGLVVSMQSAHAPEDGRWAEDRLGPERVKLAYAWQKMLKYGIPLAINSDLPGESWMPEQTLYCAVTRKRVDGNPEGGWYSGEALSVMQTLKAMTLTSAYAGFEENKIGSLALGKYADYILLDKDPVKMNPNSLMSIKVTEVYIDGVKVE